MYGINEPIREDSPRDLADENCPLCQGCGEIIVCGWCNEGVYHSSCDDTFRYDCKCTKLGEIRQKIDLRIRSLYPNFMEVDYHHMMNGKFSIDSWIGDCFPVILRELKLSDDYEFYRKLLFVD